MTLILDPIKMGLPQMQRLSQDLASTLPDKILEEATERIVAYAVSVVPVKTGYLQSTIGNEKGDNGGWNVFAKASYAGFVEYGTERQEAQPFMEPAINTVLGGKAKEIMISQTKLIVPNPTFQMLFMLKVDEVQDAKNELDETVKAYKVGKARLQDVNDATVAYQKALRGVNTGTVQARREFAYTHPVLFQSTQIFNKLGMASSTFFTLFNSLNINTIRDILQGTAGVHNMEIQVMTETQAIRNMPVANYLDINYIQAMQQLRSDKIQLGIAQNQAVYDTIDSVAAISLGALSTMAAVTYIIEALELAKKYWLNRSVISKMRAESLANPLVPKPPELKKIPVPKFKKFLMDEVPNYRDALGNNTFQVNKQALNDKLKNTMPDTPKTQTKLNTIKDQFTQKFTNKKVPSPPPSTDKPPVTPQTPNDALKDTAKIPKIPGGPSSAAGDAGVLAKFLKFLEKNPLLSKMVKFATDNRVVIPLTAGAIAYQFFSDLQQGKTVGQATANVLDTIGNPLGLDFSHPIITKVPTIQDWLRGNPVIPAPKQNTDPGNSWRAKMWKQQPSKLVTVNVNTKGSIIVPNTIHSNPKFYSNSNVVGPFQPKTSSGHQAVHSAVAWAVATTVHNYYSTMGGLNAALSGKTGATPAMIAARNRGTPKR